SIHTLPTVLHLLSLHDALPISGLNPCPQTWWRIRCGTGCWHALVTPPQPCAGHEPGSWRPIRFASTPPMASVDPRPKGHTATARSEEHTSELQSRENLVCRLLL